MLNDPKVDGYIKAFFAKPDGPAIDQIVSYLAQSAVAELR
jgi:hypothetical protein